MKSFRTLFATATILVTAVLLNAEAATYHVSVQPIQVCDDAGGSCSNLLYSEAGVNALFAQADLGVNFLPTSQLHSSLYLNLALDDSAGLASLWGLSPDYTTVLDPLANGAQPSPIINVWFTTSPTPGPFGQPLVNSNKSAMSGIPSGFEDNVLAHLLGHNFGLIHDPIDPDNLMYHDPTAGDNNFLTAAQISQIQGSALVSTVPVPAAVWLFGSALGLVAFLRRRTAR